MASLGSWPWALRLSAEQVIPRMTVTLNVGTVVETVGLEEASELFCSGFQWVPDHLRLSAARRFGIRDENGSLLAAAAVEPATDGIPYLWLFSVSAGVRRQGLGRSLLRGIVETFGREGNIAIQLKTYGRWEGMRGLLRTDGWSLIGAEPSKRNDLVGEIWKYPLGQDPLGIVVVGANPAGRGGEWVKKIRQLDRIWKLEAVVDLDPAVRGGWQKEGLAAYPATSEVAADRNVRAVVIAVPPGFAVAEQVRCLERGWAVLVEKPFGKSLTELADLQEALLRSPVPFVPGVQRRSHPSYVAMQTSLAGKEVESMSIELTLGRPLRQLTSGHRADVQQCRGGALIDLGYHALDLAQFLLQSPLEMVSCSLSEMGDLRTSSGIESAADLLGRAGKTWVRIHIDRHGGAKTEAVQARTMEGTWSANRERVVDPSGAEVFACPGSWALAESGRLCELAVACRQPSPVTVDLWEHLAAFETIERAYGLAELQGLKGVAV